MRLLLDEDSQSPLLTRLLREAGHDVLTTEEARLASHRDANILAHAVQQQRDLITRKVRDFLELHRADPRHFGILIEHQDHDPAKNMSSTALVRAVCNLEASGWKLAGQFVALNAWNFQPDRRD